MTEEQKATIKALVDKLIEALIPVVETALDIVRQVLDNIQDPDAQTLRPMLEEFLIEEIYRRSTDNEQHIRSPTDADRTDAGQSRKALPPPDMTR